MARADVQHSDRRIDQSGYRPPLAPHADSSSRARGATPSYAALNQNLVDFEQLKAWSKFQRPTDVIRWLSQHQVPYFVGRDGLPATTLQAINSRLIGNRLDDEEFNFGI